MSTLRKIYETFFLIVGRFNFHEGAYFKYFLRAKFSKLYPKEILPITVFLYEIKKGVYKAKQS